MIKYFFRRLFTFVLSLALASIVIFSLVEIAPGDPASFMLGINAQPDTIAALRSELGLDQPKINRYFDWIGGMLYSAGMSYLNLGDYVNAIDYLDQFDTDDIILNALAKGAIGDAFAQIDQPEEAYAYYVAAFEASDNSFSAPKYLFKAGILGASLGKNSAALKYFKRIEAEYPESAEAAKVAVQIGRLENL